MAATCEEAVVFDDSTNSELIRSQNASSLKNQIETPLLGDQKEIPLERPRGAYNILILNMGISGCFFGVFYVLYEMLVEIGFSSSMGVFMVNTLLSLNYICALLGAQMADRFLGKFKTLVVFTAVLLLGLGILAVSSVPDVKAPALTFIGLLCIVAGYGAANPCVSSFLGDQFSDAQMHLSSRFFAFFYGSVQAGSLVTGFVVPPLRPILGGYVFSILAVMMLVSFVAFISARQHYIKVSPIKKTSIPSLWPLVFLIIGLNIRHITSKSNRESAIHKLKDIHGDVRINEAKSIVHVLKVFFAVPMYFAVYFQLFSMWQVTATQLNPEIFPGVKIDVAMITTLDPLFVLIWTPVFSYIIYPAYKSYFGYDFQPLRRMVYGLCMTVLSFTSTSLVQLFSVSTPHMNVLWMVPQFVLISSSEILFISTGIEYAYLHAPARMKAVITALFWVAVSLGNQIIAISAISQKEFTPMGMATQYFIFTGVMVLVTIVFYFWCIYGREKDAPAINESEGVENDDDV